MDIDIRRVGLEALEELAQLRIDFLKDLRADQADVETHHQRDYARTGLESGLYLGYIGRVGSAIAGGACVLVSALPPFEKGPRRVGTVLNVYVYPEYRRKGYGRALMRFIIDEARREGIDRLFLHATAGGEPLYESLGFREPGQKAMIIDLGDQGGV